VVVVCGERFWVLAPRLRGGTEHEPCPSCKACQGQQAHVRSYSSISGVVAHVYDRAALPCVQHDLLRGAVEQSSSQGVQDKPHMLRK
jgi:hypothetical protein